MIKNIPYALCNIYLCALLQTQHFVNDFGKESINVFVQTISNKSHLICR